jgi:hypothetical protein
MHPITYFVYNGLPKHNTITLIAKCLSVIRFTNNPIMFAIHSVFFLGRFDSAVSAGANGSLLFRRHNLNQSPDFDCIIY